MQCKPGKVSNKSKVNMEALGLIVRTVSLTGNGGAGADLSQLPSHLACMYLCLLHGPKCIFFSFMQVFAAEHRIFIRVRNLSALPTKTSGNRLMSRLYSSLARAISNSARKFSSITTLASFLLFDFSTTSR